MLPCLIEDVTEHGETIRNTDDVNDHDVECEFIKLCYLYAGCGCNICPFADVRGGLGPLAS